MLSTWDVLQDAGVISVAPPVTTPAAGTTFNAVFTEQEQPRWCWVACAAMALTQLGAETVPPQCQIASLRCGGDCCANPSRCDQPCPFTEVQRFLAQLSIEAEHSARLPLQDLTQEVFSGRPVQLGYDNPSSPPDGHVVLIIGDSVINGEKAFRVADPLGKKRLWRYERLLEDEYGRSWAHTWHKLSYRRSTTAEPLRLSRSDQTP